MQNEGTNEWKADSSYSKCVNIFECDTESKCLAIDLYRCKYGAIVNTIGSSGIVQAGASCDALGSDVPRYDYGY